MREEINVEDVVPVTVRQKHDVDIVWRQAFFGQLLD
jgi:hypothetical protein